MPGPINLPRLRRPRNPIRVREDGTHELMGMSPREWLVSIFALIALWLVMAGVFAGLLAVATAVRDRGDLYTRPGLNVPFPDPPK